MAKGGAPKVLFLTGTRADFGKLKPLMLAVEASDAFDCEIFVTGMHTLSRYGLTMDEVRKSKFQKIHTFMNQVPGEPMEMILANTIAGLSRYVHEQRPDLIVVHGDRVEALAGAIVGAIQNIRVAHIEGGELSGTIDGLIRHSVSKLSHIHFVANQDAAERLKQLGENPNSIHVIGSPDIDVMMSPHLPELETVKAYYEIPFGSYGIAIFHPVTTDLPLVKSAADSLVDAMIESEKNFVVIYPNNDEGCEFIFEAYKKLENRPRFRLIPSLRFEYFLTLLKNADFIVGNSSAGIREAPAYGVPSIDIGNRQEERFMHTSILNIGVEKSEIASALHQAATSPKFEACHHFGTGDSTQRFMEVLSSKAFWNMPLQKKFFELRF